MSAVDITFPTPGELESMIAALDGTELDHLLRQLDVAQRRIEAAIVAVCDRAGRTGHFVFDGHRSVASWVAATTNCSAAEANARRRSARALRQLASVREQFQTGQVGVAQVRELGRLAANPRTADQLPDSEQVLLHAATSFEYADFRVITQRWEQLADADGAHRHHEQTHDSRNARLSVVGAEFRFETSHGALDGAAMRSVFEAFCQVEFDRDWREARAQFGPSATAGQLARTAAQRRADAFTAMVHAAAAAGTGDGRPIEATVNLVVDVDQFEQYLAAEVADTRVDITPSSVRTRRCETTDGVPVDPRLMVAAALIGRVRSIVCDQRGVIVNAGRKRRLFDGALREAIHAIDPVCGWLGCNLRAGIADIDHLQPAARGGPTDAANAKVLCKKHNLFKHVHGYRLLRNDDGSISIVRPDGTPLAFAHAA